jgi:GntR family transcriptional regulator
MNATSLVIDKSLPTPAYLQLSQQLKAAIQAGSLTAGSAIPSERDLAEALGLSRMTVRRALEELVSARYVEQRRGSGTYVTGRRLEQPVDRVLGFVDEARNLGFKPGSVLLSIRKQGAGTKVAGALGVSIDTPVLAISRLRTADDEPIALQTAHLIPLLSELSHELLKRTGSLYQTLNQQFGVRPHHARQIISARLPSKYEQTMLAIGETMPVLALERITLNIEGHPFEYVESAYRSDRYQMILELTS